MRVYDFDKTIYEGDSSVDFFKYCLKKNRKCVLVLPKLLLVFILYVLKIYEKEKFKSCFFSIVKYFDNIDKVVKDFWDKKEYKLKDFYLNQRKKDDIIISASPEFLLKPVAKKYKFNLIASRVNKKTGEFLSKNCYGEEKVSRLKEEMKIDSIDEFYSDSLSDLPLSNIAKKSFIIKDDKIIPWNEYKLSLLGKIKKVFFNRDFIMFLFIGFINAFNGIWIAYVFSLFISNAIIAYVLGFLVSLTIAYILNTLLNFKTSLTLNKYLKFCLSNIPNFLIQLFSVIVLLNILKVPKIFSYAISSVVAVPITFVLIKLHVFNKK